MHGIPETKLLLPLLAVNPGTSLSHSNPEGPLWAVGNEADQLPQKTINKITVKDIGSDFMKTVVPCTHMVTNLFATYISQRS